MTIQTPEYSHGRHIAAVQAAARAAGVKGAAYVILSYMCSAADFRRPTVRVSKAGICDKTGYHWDTVRLALGTLRGLGMIEPVAYATGGRHMATVYTLRTGKGAENPTPIYMQDTQKGGGISGQKGAENPVKRGRNFRPPSMDHSNDPSRVTGSASRAGLQSRPLDHRQGGDAGAVPRMTGQERALVATFSADVTRLGYGEASRRDKLRRADPDWQEGKGQ